MKDLRPPSPFSILNEGLTGLELARLALTWPVLARLPRGDGRPVIVCPGFSADDASTFALRACLRALGHDAVGWGLGRNLGGVPSLIPRLAERVVALAEQAGDRVALVGWSLGGYLAREVARERPHAVRRVVTLGSPILGGPRYTQLAALYRAQGYDLAEIERIVQTRERLPITVPITVLYSRLDGVVAWQACVDRSEQLAENIEVRTTHFGFGFSTEVYRIVADRLVQADARGLRV
ncbi:MAG: alpha/beta hydrolase [Pseudomonadales bacterium]|nr:alpha/beta hydrolase [Pseudomonadales bacterium]